MFGCHLRYQFCCSGLQGLLVKEAPDVLQSQHTGNRTKKQFALDFAMPRRSAYIAAHVHSVVAAALALVHVVPYNLASLLVRSFPLRRFNQPLRRGDLPGVQAVFGDSSRSLRFGVADRGFD